MAAYIVFTRRTHPRRIGACSLCAQGRASIEGHPVTVVAGGASGKLKVGRHTMQPQHTPMSNLALLDKLGVHQDTFGDSTSKLDI